MYCRGKENGIYILQSIDHDPFDLGTTRDTLGTTPEGGDGKIVVQNVQGRQNQNQRNFARGAGVARNRGAQNRAGNANDFDFLKDKMLLDASSSEWCKLDEEEHALFWMRIPTAQVKIHGQLGPQSEDLKIYMSVHQMHPIFSKEQFDEVQRSLVKEVRAMEAEVDQNVIDKKCREIERKNLLITNENLIANCIARMCLLLPTALTCGTMPADPQGNNTPVEYNLVVQIILWYLDSGFSKHMTGDRSRLRNFVKKFIGTVRFINDHFGAIMGYGDYVIGDNVISRVYYVEGLGHNLLSVGQFFDSDLEVAFKKHTCFVRDLDGVDLIKGSRGTNLYTISVEEIMRSSPICLLSKASKNKSWLWHCHLNHLNFGTLNDLARKDLVRGLHMLKFEKDHLCSACQLGKSRKATHKPITVNTIMEVLHTLYMDLCGPMRDETPKFVVKLLKQLQADLNKTVRNVRTDNGTEFVNKDLTAYYESVDITHEKTIPRTPQPNDVVERWNRTLVEAAQTMLIFSKAPMFLWAEAIATACYTQNRSLIHTLHNKTPYELVHDKKPDLSFLRVFGALCYPTNDSEDLGKLKAKADISSGPAPNLLMPGPISFGLVPNPTPAAPYVHPTYKELEILFQPMFDEYFEPPTVDRLVPPVLAAQVPVNPSGSSVSISVDQDAPLGNHSPSSSDHQSC
ncbi:retrovirus-related pol polyprotein from transposon TNT 1-94 [Tanacetum coccineum]